MNILRIFFITLILPGVKQVGAQHQIGPVPAKEIQIKIAVMAAPAEQAENATVLGYNTEGKLTTLRQGTNQLVCLADEPWKNNIHVACYHRDLEPFMAMGRQLKAEGRSTQEIRQMRREAVESGTLKMPEKPASLFVFDADQEMTDLSTGEVRNGRLRAVVHIPYLTGEESGLPTEPVGGGLPWLMDAGTHRAHIMITPPR